MKREWGKYTDENIAFNDLKQALETALGRELHEDEAKSVKWLAGAGWDTVGRFVDMFREIVMNTQIEEIEVYDNGYARIKYQNGEVKVTSKIVYMDAILTGITDEDDAE
jgi:hypothetical protein